MKTESAAGRKTDRFESAARRLEERMETQLELLTDAMRGAVTRADAVDDGDDEYGHRRDSHIGQAVKIGSVSAQIVVALGKYAGEFNHNITIKRTDENAAPGNNSRRTPDNSRLGRALARARIGVQDEDYDVSDFSSHLPFDHALDEGDTKRDAERAADPDAATGGAVEVPPPANSGSNG